LSDLISALLVTSTFTVCLSRTDRLARNTNRSRVAALIRTIFFRKMTTYFSHHSTARNFHGKRRVENAPQ
jgi:hypothetical protein